MKRILLSKGKVAIIDNNNYEEIKKHKWCLHSNGYAFRKLKISEKKCKHQNEYMHRLINKTPPGMGTDHINGDKLDNRKKNLRNATKSQNTANSIRTGQYSSRFKGVHWHKLTKKWRAQIKVNGASKHLGLYSCELVASLAYEGAAKNYFGEYTYSSRNVFKHSEWAKTPLPLL